MIDCCCILKSCCCRCLHTLKLSVAFSQSVVSGQVVNGNCCFCCCRCWWSMKKHYCHRPLLSLRERDFLMGVRELHSFSQRSCQLLFLFLLKLFFFSFEIGDRNCCRRRRFSPLFTTNRPTRLTDWTTERERKMNRKMIVVNYGCCCCICCWSAEVNCRHKTNKQIRSKEIKKERGKSARRG